MKAIRIAERFPILGSLPVPPWVERAIAAHERWMLVRG